MDSPVEANETPAPNEESRNAAPGMSNALYSAYREHRNAVRCDERDAAQSYDKWLLTLSGGALGLSMAFARDIAMPTGGTAGDWLLGAWFLLVVAIVVGLVGLFQSERAHRVFREVLDDEADRVGRGCAGEPGFWARVRDNKRARNSAAWVVGLNWFSLFCFVVGITLMSGFAYFTLSNGELQMPDERRDIVEKPLTDRPIPVPAERSDKSVDGVPFSRERPALGPDRGPVDQAPAPTPKPEKGD